MWQCKYAREPFNMRLYAMRCIQNAGWIVLGFVLGVLIIGGGYYLKNVSFAGALPYEVVTKYYVEYEQDPESDRVFSYFTGYTWNDWIKSGELSGRVQELLGTSLPVEEFTAFYEMSMPSDVRMPYLTVSHTDAKEAERISEAVTQVLSEFGENQREIRTVSVVDVIGPRLERPDIRTWRACVLGAVVGTFFALFYLSVKLIIEGAIYLPETFTYRYQIPMIGYCDREGVPSLAVKVHLDKLMSGKSEIGITSLEEDIDLIAYKRALGLDEAVCIPSVLQVPEAGTKLAETQGNILLVKYGKDNAGAMEELIHFCEIQNIKIDCALLVEADASLIRWYRGCRK